MFLSIDIVPTVRRENLSQLHFPQTSQIDFFSTRSTGILIHLEVPKLTHCRNFFFCTYESRNHLQIGYIIFRKLFGVYSLSIDAVKIYFCNTYCYISRVTKKNFLNRKYLKLFIFNLPKSVKLFVSNQNIFLSVYYYTSITY